MFLKHLKNKHGVEQSESHSTLIVDWEKKINQLKWTQMTDSLLSSMNKIVNIPDHTCTRDQRHVTRDTCRGWARCSAAAAARRMTRAGSTARGRGSSASATHRLRSVAAVDTMVEDMDRDTYFQHTTILSLLCSELITVSSDIKLSDQNSSIIRGLP